MASVVWLLGLKKLIIQVLVLFSQTLIAIVSPSFKNSGKLVPQNLILLFIIKATPSPFLFDDLSFLRILYHRDFICWFFGQTGFLKASNIDGIIIHKRY